MRRRVALDLLYFTGRRGGTETYVREIVPRLARAMDDVDLVALVGSSGADLVAPWFPGEVRTLPVDARRRAAWAAAETWLVARVAAREGAALLWCPANYGPPAGRIPTVVTVHDVIPFVHVPPGMGRTGQRITIRLLRRAARGATRVLAVSDDGARRVSSMVGVPMSRITVAPNGASDLVVPADPEDEVRAIGRAPNRQLLLSTGNRMPHKNFPGLIQALAEIPADRRPQLVVSGGGPDDPLRDLVERLDLSGDVLLPGWLTASQLGALHALATLYVCPSLDEGFGLPVVDAMRAGCPVLASDIPVLHEVGGDAVEYADARDPRTLAEAIDRLLADPARRETLRGRGRARAAQFTWDHAAEITAEVLHSALAEVRGS